MSMSVRGFSPEQEAFADAVADFCRREAGTVEQRAKLTDGGRESHNADLYRKFAQAGLLGVAVPEEYGGSGGGLAEQCLMFEQLFHGLAPLHGAGSSHTVAGVIKHYGTEAQKASLLAQLSSGAVMSISISEPGAGSDAAAISCRAEPVDNGFVVNGQKTWCSDAQFATGILLVARTARGERPHDGLTMLYVPADIDGLTIRPISTMGGSEVNDLFFTDVFVPETDVVGEVGGGWKQLMSGLNGERLVAAAQGLGMAQRTFDDLLGYLREREQFGKPIGSFQALRHRVADLAIEIEASRALTYDTVRRVEIGGGRPEELVRLTSMAKVKVTETAKRTALEGVQMMGGYGYATEYGMERPTLDIVNERVARHLRTAIAPTIYAGTNEIQRDIISSTYGLR